MEQRLLERFSAVPEFSGWEIPYDSELHPHGEEWFRAHPTSRAELVVTLIPGVVRRLDTDPSFGLASQDEDGRRRAVSIVADVFAAIRQLEELVGRPVVRAVELHSSPRPNVGSSGHSLRESLLEIAGWYWRTTRLLVEHCDAAIPGQSPSKGFLNLEEELDVMAEVNKNLESPVHCLVNWGRSAIERRDSRTPIDHIRLARSGGLLGGVIFSGCSDRPDSRGGAWADMHVPPRSEIPGAEHSLLDKESIRASLRAIGDASTLTVFGMKISTPPTASLKDREEIVRRANDAILTPARRRPRQLSG